MISEKDPREDCIHRKVCREIGEYSDCIGVECNDYVKLTEGLAVLMKEKGGI